MSEDRSARAGATALQMIAEMQQFATFTAAEQRYVRRSLDVAQGGVDAIDRWARGILDAGNIGLQAKAYAVLGPLRDLLLTDIDLDDTSTVLPALIKLSAFDLQNGKLTSFAAYRFLYERLLGPGVRPWLLSAFSAASALPCIHPELRGDLMSSLGDHDMREAGWSSREPTFVPAWIEKVPAALR